MLIGARRALLRRPKIVAAGGSPTWTKTAGPTPQNIAYGSASATFSSTAVNNAATSDTIVVMVGERSHSNGPTTGVTIGGDAMTSVIQTAGATPTHNCSIWRRTGNIYTTPNIVVTAAGSVYNFVGITVGYLANVTTTATDTDKLDHEITASPQSAGAVTNPNPGVVLAVAMSEYDGSDPTWNNITEDYDLATALGDGLRLTSGYSTTAGSVTAGITGWHFVGTAIAVAAWGA
jgi:hypothetical protein